MRRLALVVVTLALAGCGFHAAGSRALPAGMERVHVDTVVPYQVVEPRVETRLRSLLRQRGAQVLDRAQSDGATLRLTQIREAREVRTVGADGKALEYDLILRVDFDLQRDGAVLVPPDQVEVRRDYSFNPGQLLAKEQEALRLREFLEEEAAQLILFRIEARLARSAAPAVAGDAAPVLVPSRDEPVLP